MRLFFAIQLPPDIRSTLARLRPADDREYRWVDPAQMHVTLAFLGEQNESTLAILLPIGASAATSAPPLKLRLGAPGSFGPKRAPRVLWIGLEGDLSALQTLQSDLATRLRSASFAIEGREFRPHVTLARRREGSPAELNSWPPRAPTGSFSVEHLTLFQSRLSPRGATYQALETFPLGH